MKKKPRTKGVACRLRYTVDRDKLFNHPTKSDAFFVRGKTEKLLQASKQVILDCCLENGGIVAANSTMPYYPKDAKNYFYVWPRDASYICLATDVIGLKDIQENFFAWLSSRAENWKETGLFYEKYYPNGLKARKKFQPDQTSSVLLAIYNFVKKDKAKIYKHKELITKSADGICKAWRNDHFIIPTNDLWEERLTFPDVKDNFSYSLAACVKGLQCANKLFSNKEYIKTAGQMKQVLIQAARKKGYFFRSFGKLNDERIDASLLGLVWPFEIVKANSALAQKTIKLIENKLVEDYGVYRREHDNYDGWMFEKELRNKGAGYWPLLNFWMSIVLSKAGRKKEALKYYNKVLNSTDKFIPEQIFNNNIQKSVSPLCWSHAMFILASKELGIL